MVYLRMGLQPFSFSYLCVGYGHYRGLNTDQGEVCEFRIIHFFLSHATTTSTVESPPERGELVHGKSISFGPGRNRFSFLLCYRFSLWTSVSNLDSLWFSVMSKIVVIAWPFITNAHKRKWIKEMLSQPLKLRAQGKEESTLRRWTNWEGLK